MVLAWCNPLGAVGNSKKTHMLGARRLYFFGSNECETELRACTSKVRPNQAPKARNQEKNLVQAPGTRVATPCDNWIAQGRNRKKEAMQAHARDRRQLQQGGCERGGVTR